MSEPTSTDPRPPGSSPRRPRRSPRQSFLRRAAVGLLAVAAASSLWLPSLHLFFEPGDAELEGLAEELRAEQLAGLDDPARIAAHRSRMRLSNAEWDFMGRTFLTLALAERAHQLPEGSPEGREERARALRLIDQMLEDTLREERAHGPHHFLMPYSLRRPFVQQPARSIFLDGEIALMLGARLSLAPDPELDQQRRERIDLIASRMEASPMVSGESYPNECWTFCNTVALAAIRVSDRVDGRDHGPLFRRWLENAREHLIDEETGLLVSSYTYDGQPLDGPEGSSIFLAAHMLRLIDPAFAEDQYRRARRELGEEVLGFGYAREWPRSWEGPADIDSGPVIPLFEASAGASGMAVLGAAAFDDREALRSLAASLELFAFPLRDEGRLRYAASNQVGDAVLLYALSLAEGPRSQGGEPSAFFREVLRHDDGHTEFAHNTRHTNEIRR